MLRLRHRTMVESMIMFIDGNRTNPSLNLQLVASQVHLSEKYANLLFKKMTGTTINAFIIFRKMELAAQLLEDPCLKIYEVCDRIGYSDQDYFRVSFKKHYGFTPSDFRDRVSGRQGPRPCSGTISIIKG